MTIEDIVRELDAEITRLEQVKALLSNGHGASVGRQLDISMATGRKRRTLSPEARKRIADAQRKRWAAQKAKE